MPESRFYTSYVALLAIVVSVLGCGRRGDPPSNAPEKAALSQDVPAAAATGSLVPDWRDARSELPAHNARGLFQGHEPSVPTERRPRPVRPADPIPPGPSGPLPPPLTYVGKVARDGEGFAVLAREERVYVVRVGDAVGNGYRVESISEKEVVIRNADFDMTQTLFFSAGRD
jgi:hypothetical protein